MERSLAIAARRVQRCKCECRWMDGWVIRWIDGLALLSLEQSVYQRHGAALRAGYVRPQLLWLNSSVRRGLLCRHCLRLWLMSLFPLFGCVCVPFRLFPTVDCRNVKGVDSMFIPSSFFAPLTALEKLYDNGMGLESRNRFKL